MPHGSHIQFHRSAVEGATPNVATMLEGEPAVNLADKKLFIKGATGELLTFIGGVSAETVAGSSGQIQFNAESGFSANPNFVIKSSHDPPQIGIGTASPREALEVQGTILSAGISADGASFGSKGITSSGPIFVDNAPVTIKGSGDVTLNLIADTDNSGENDNPIISMGQDGAEARFNLGVVGESGQIFTNSLANSAFLDTANANTDLQFAVAGDMKMTLLDNGKVGVGTKAPREKLEVSGIIQATGVSADGATFTTLKGGIITATSYFAGAVIGDLVGNANTASTATLATTANAVQLQGKGDNKDYNIIFADHNQADTTANLAAKVDGGSSGEGLIYNPGTDTLQTGNVHAIGISGDGATFGARGLTVDGDLYLGNQSRIRVQGDTDSLYLNAGGGQLQITYTAVDIAKQLRHSGDTNTMLEFTTDNVSLQAGGTEFLEANATGVVHTPIGVSGGGATFGVNGITVGGNIYFADATQLTTATRTDSYTGQIETAADKTYTLDPKVAAARTVTAFYIKSASGTVTATLRNGSDTIKAASVSDSSGAQTSLANTSLAEDAVLTLVCSSNSSALDVIFSVEYTTTL